MVVGCHHDTLLIRTEKAIAINALSFNAVRWLDSVNKLAQSTLEDRAKGEVGDIEA